MQPRSIYLTIDTYEIHLTDWGEIDAPVIIMWHGLTRTGRDFDFAAHWLASKGKRVICPDTLGRGLSAWAQDPAHYNMQFYQHIAANIVNWLNRDRIDWIGTSMGGALGMVAASHTLKGRIGKLVINDVGPELPQESVQRILTYTSNIPNFTSIKQTEAFLREIHAPFGPLSDQEWQTMTEQSARRRDDGSLTLHYDPRIIEQLGKIEEYSLWQAWLDLPCPVLVLQGAESDVLPDSIIRKMQDAPPASANVRYLVVPGCGHAPFLNIKDQLDPITDFLTS